MNRALTIMFGVLLLLKFGSAKAQTDIDFNKPIVACYLAHSAIAGTLKCDPPSTLVGAVFGACDQQEQAFIATILSSGGGGFDRQEVADIAIRRVHERMAPIIQNWILGAQAGRPACEVK